MWMPFHDEFDRLWADKPGIGHYFAPPVHPDPRMYKYAWRIWTRASPWAGADFFRQVPVLSMSGFRQLEKQLIDGREHFFVYGVQRPRLGEVLEQCSPPWTHVVFAPAYDDDTDAVWNGHK